MHSGSIQKKDSDSRSAFKVNVTYNSILDDEDEEDEVDKISSYASSAQTKDSAVDTLCVSRDDTQFSSLVCDDESSLQHHTKRRRVVKKKIVKESCLGVDVLPDSFQNSFPFRHFNRMQSEAFPSIYESDENCVVSSPTGSGKTVLFELAIMRLMRNLNQSAENIKILYIAPTKSLCCEKFKNWRPTFLNLTVGMLTSDTSFLETEKVKRCNIIITTPEKWDLLTRKWKDYSRMFELIKLVLVDEVHILRERRGATLEVVLTRMNLLCDNIRIIAVSATIPNVEDIAEWLKSKASCSVAKVLAFDDSYRQVSLERWVYGVAFNNKNEFQHDPLYNLKLPDIFRKHSKHRPVLIFCPTRASTISTAKYVAQNCYSFLQDRKEGQTSRFGDQALTDCFQNGVAFHHAGLSMGDRESVEQGFLNGTIKVLCSTSTLAVGVNLPAYLVIIKGTRMWNASVAQEYTQLDIMQMIGRAGRPQFEKDGCAVILTDSTMKSSYEKLLHGTDLLESSLHLELIEHLAAEISLSTVFSTQSAVTWLRNTFFYVRFKKNPMAYSEVNRLVKDGFEQDSQIFRFSNNLLNVLLEYGIVEEQNHLLASTPFGDAMARHYVLFESMKLFLTAKSGLSVEGILHLLTNAKEFADIRLRQKEKRLYKEINNSPLLKYPYRTEGKQSQTVTAANQKVSLIIQYELGGLEFPSYNGAFALHQSMAQDKMLVFRHCFRILKCIVDIFVEKKDGVSLKNALFLLRSVNGTCWEDSAMVLRQLKSIGLISVRKLVQKDIHTLQEFGNLSDQQIECYLGLKMGNGSKIRRDVELLPQLQLHCRMEDSRVDQLNAYVTFKVEISAKYRSAIWHGQSLSVDVEVLKATGELLDFRRISLKHLSSPRSFRVIALINSRYDEIEFTINCLEVAGLGEKTTVYAEKLLPSHFHAPPINTDGNARSSIDLLDEDFLEDSPLSDDSILQYLDENSKQPRSKRTPTVENLATNRRVRSNGNFECYHTCKDKTKCRHLCCKEGIPRDCLRGKKSTENHNMLPTHEVGWDYSVAGPKDTKDANASQLPNRTVRNLDRDDRFGSFPHNPLREDVPTTNTYTLMPCASVAAGYIRHSPSPRILTQIDEVQKVDLEFLGSDVELC